MQLTSLRPNKAAFSELSQEGVQHQTLPCHVLGGREDLRISSNFLQQNRERAFPRFAFEMRQAVLWSRVLEMLSGAFQPTGSMSSC